MRVLTDIRWDSTLNKLIKSYREITLPKVLVSHVSVETEVDVGVIETGGNFDIRYNASSAQLQKSTDGGTTWTMITGGQAVEETV